MTDLAEFDAAPACDCPGCTPSGDLEIELRVDHEERSETVICLRAQTNPVRDWIAITDRVEMVAVPLVALRGLAAALLQLADDLGAPETPWICEHCGEAFASRRARVVGALPVSPALCTSCLVKASPPIVISSTTRSTP